MLIIIRAIRVVSLHHEYLESHECSCVYNSCDSCDSCCFPFTTNFSNLTNVAVFIIRLIRAIRVVSLHHEYPESHECSCALRFV